MRLLVVSYAFPPYNSIGGLRVGKTVKYLLKSGHDVRVLTALDQPFQPTLPVEAPPENVIYSRCFNVRKPAEVALGKNANAAVENKRPEGGRLSATFKKVLGFPLRTFVYFPDANIGWLPYAVAAGKSLMANWKPDLILASSPPPTSLLVAHRLSKKFGVPWVADLRDLWVDHQYYKQPGWRKAVETKLEKRVLSSAAGLVTVSEPLAERLRAKYRQPTIVVLNGFDPGDYPAVSGSTNSNDELRVLYTGATYPGKQDVSPLFAALRQLGSLAEKVRVVFHGSYLNSIRETAEQYKVEHLVEVKAAVPYKESLRMQSESDILLLLLWTDTRERGVYTGKLFEYIGARRPILAIGGVDCVAAELITSRHAGVALNEPGAIADRLQQWIRQKDEAGGIPRLPEESLIGISREEQVGVLEGFLAGRLESQLK